MSIQIINNEDRLILLELARRSIEMATQNRKLPQIKMGDYSQKLQENGASFVTLTRTGNLRGCIGTLQAYQPLVLDVIEHAAAAATEDYRFQPVSSDEISGIAIEISVLSDPVKKNYKSIDDLLSQLIPGESGVILKDGRARATFLPQVWGQLPDKSEFLSHLCSKMGAPSSLWKTKNLEVFTYQVEEFHD